jgi:hypothetical protein
MHWKNILITLAVLGLVLFAGIRGIQTDQPFETRINGGTL